MKNVFRVFSLTMTICLVSLLFISCGEGSESLSTNDYLGDLPSIAKNYITKIDAKEEAIKQNTSMDEAFKLDKELNLLEDEAENSVKDYIANNPITNLPFEQNVEDSFTITDVSVSQKYNSTPNILGLIVKVTMTKDVSKKSMFIYVKAIDKEGNKLNKRIGVLATTMFGKKSFKVNQEVELIGGIEKTADLVNFEKFVFISREEYDKSK